MNTFALVKGVIDEWDPFDLLALECPDDEYDNEISDIVEILLSVKDAEELATAIDQIMFKAFDEDFRKSQECLHIARKIYALLG
ncbi:MAG: hypothetical protein A2189_01525 [Paenibacillus sp. RIFOXYA1_FULL_44_5]|nr:MAG: hypothetical protein A2189_01525 [Paenibacillus sp. RIFOXYA1_FULL_44_5]